MIPRDTSSSGDTSAIGDTTVTVDNSATGQWRRIRYGLRAIAVPIF